MGRSGAEENGNLQLRFYARGINNLTIAFDVCVCVPSQGSIASSWPRSFLRLLAFPAPPSTTSATIVFPEAQQLPRLLEIGHVELPAHLVHGHASTTDNREQGHPSQQLQPPRKSKPIP